METFFMELTQTQLIVIVSILAVLTLWDVVWKAMAMWVACKRESKLWFVILLVVNSVGILFCRSLTCGIRGHYRREKRR